MEDCRSQTAEGTKTREVDKMEGSDNTTEVFAIQTEEKEDATRPRGEERGEQHVHITNITLMDELVPNTSEGEQEDSAHIIRIEGIKVRRCSGLSDTGETAGIGEEFPILTAMTWKGNETSRIPLNRKKKPRTDIEMLPERGRSRSVRRRSLEKEN